MEAYPNHDKQMYIDRVKAHRLADELIAGIGWDGKKGCSVGCTVECYDHAKYARWLGIPLVLAHLQDAIFEGLPSAERLAFPERFLESIKEGSDLSEVWPKFAIRMLRRCLARIGDGNEESTTQCRESVAQVIALFVSDATKAASAASKAAASATAWAAARSAAAWAARAAAKAAESASEARSAEDAAASAAEATARAARSAAASAWSAAWSAESAAWAARSAWASKEASAAARSARSAESAAWSAESAWASKLAARSAESDAAAAAEYAAQANDLVELLKKA